MQRDLAARLLDPAPMLRDERSHLSHPCATGHYELERVRRHAAQRQTPRAPALAYSQRRVGRRRVPLRIIEKTELLTHPELEPRTVLRLSNTSAAPNATPQVSSVVGGPAGELLAQLDREAVIGRLEQRTLDEIAGRTDIPALEIRLANCGE
jgi:hypothetical protein